MCFDNKVVLITGAASRIGEAIAIHFTKLFATLSLLDNNSDSLDKVVQKCKALREVTLLKIVVDVTKDEDLKQAVDKTIEEYKKIDVVVNCAGVFCYNNILDSDVLSVFDRVFSVNLRSMITMAHYTAPALMESKGCIINIANVMGGVVTENAISYNISKAGVSSFTKQVAKALKNKGVRINCITPGALYNKHLLHGEEDSEEETGIMYNKTDRKRFLSSVIMKNIADKVEYLAKDTDTGFLGRNTDTNTGFNYIIDSDFVLTGSRSSFIIKLDN